jgi:hypothetical protein
MALLTSIPRSPRRAARRIVAVGLAVLLALLGLASSASGQQAAQADQLKAAFVFQFANYVQWPDSAFEDASSPVVIGIVGNDAMVKTLTASVRGKTVGTRGFRVTNITSEKDVESCHIVFIDAADDKRVDDYLAYTRTKPVLTVSDDDNFTAEGGIIRLFEKDNKLRFEVNVDEAERSGITISSKLLGLAQVVHDKT